MVSSINSLTKIINQFRVTKNHETKFFLSFKETLSLGACSLHGNFTCNFMAQSSEATFAIGPFVPGFWGAIVAKASKGSDKIKKKDSQM